MAEPAGIFIEASLTEKEVKSLLRYKFEDCEYGKKVGYYFSQLLYSCINYPKNVFIFNYDKKQQRLFIVWVLNYFNELEIQPFEKILEIITSIKSSEESNYAVVASIYPDIYKGYEIYKQELKVINKNVFPKETTNRLVSTFLNFAQDSAIFEPKKALQKRNYFYKNFKNYYKKYSEHIKNTEKPQRIKNATKKEPYHLFKNFFSYDDKVFCGWRQEDFKEIIGADPLSFREINGSIVADKNFVFYRKNTHPIKPSLINKHIGGARFFTHYVLIEGIDGDSFTYVKEKWDTVYWKDKNAVFIIDKKANDLKKVMADVNSFEYIGFAYGKDKKNVFYNDQIIAIDVNNFKLNKNGFIWDDLNIFSYSNKIPLDAKTFKIKKYDNDVNPFIGDFILEDKTGLYKYNGDWNHKKQSKNFIFEKIDN